MIKSKKKIVDSIYYLSRNSYNLKGYKIKLHPSFKEIKIISKF